MNTRTLRIEHASAHQKRQWQSFMAALSLEGLVVVSLVAWLATHPNVILERVTPLSIDPIISEKQEPAPPLQKVSPPTLPPTPTAKPQHAIQPPSPTPSAQLAPESSPAANPEPVAVSPTPHTVASVKSAPPLPAPPAHPVAPALDPAIAYNAKLAAAVQAAFEVPSTAAALNFKGRTRVEFNLLDSAVSAIRIVQSSGLGAADRAALKAVQTAVFPSPPAGLQGKSGTYQIWVACL